MSLKVKTGTGSPKSTTAKSVGRRSPKPSVWQVKHCLRRWATGGRRREHSGREYRPESVSAACRLEDPLPADRSGNWSPRAKGSRGDYSAAPSVETSNLFHFGSWVLSPHITLSGVLSVLPRCLGRSPRRIHSPLPAAHCLPHAFPTYGQSCAAPP